MSWNVSLDRGVCIGSGMCTGAAPDHFEFDFDDGMARAVAAEVAPDDSVVEAADACPVEAILVRSADGTVVAPTA
ncbi:ferredoxin [Nocardiopsis ansamitocini]|uniref:Ferredoxin n=1 Tax=Nocardiopsis ansamitocini TaxID=1670832 RepID=A0A9W6P827_9ACTN|nr:ferredoxin [Nocardiopsis ansamitocini]GLU48774.1 hypothetical protein Nans01_31250 [Nocardiopsis ansamitocini]